MVHTDMTILHIARLKKIFSLLLQQFLLCALIGSASSIFAEGGAPSGAGNNLSADAIGQVTLVLGKAHIESARNSRQRADAGTEIFVGDQIITQSNGTVLLHFIDDASVSVRQDSHLEIVSYQFDEAKPEDSRVKFNLIHGVTRAISGKAAKAARKQFRLNTPIAAIGVRGTDFVVSATGSSTRARVNEGIIVLAPFSANCSTDSFGPCAANALELAGYSMDTITMDDSGSSPRILPAAQNRGSQVLQDEVQTLLAINAGNQTVASNDEYVEEVFVEESNSTQVVVNTTTSPVTPEPVTPEPVTPEPVTPEPVTLEPVTPEPVSPDPITSDPVTPDPVILDSVIPDFTPEVPTTALALTENQLVWGRFAQGKGDLERITLIREDASINRGVTVGNFEYILFRDEGDKRRVDNNLSVVDFDLSSAQAFYNSPAGVVAMQVVDGSLGIDFQQNSFATELNLNHSLTGEIDFIASGSLFDGGFFHSRNETKNIAGAVSFDGTEAGYFFDQQLEGASIEGLTLWNGR
jgi:hypothetical protein